MMTRSIARATIFGDGATAMLWSIVFQAALLRKESSEEPGVRSAESSMRFVAAWKLVWMSAGCTSVMRMGVWASSWRRFSLSALSAAFVALYGPRYGMGNR